MATAAVLVSRATTTALIGPDWAMNLEICDIVNRDPGQAKDAIKMVKKRLNSKNPKVQLLTLTILETLIKNCGGVIHQHVAEKNILPKMVKLVKKKGDMHVKDKILVLLATWQEAFGGPEGRFPQYYYAYEELRRIGVHFPERSVEDGPPVLTPQTHPISSYRSPGFGSPNHVPTSSDAPATIEESQMSLADIETARGSLEVLSEMLNAVNPHDRLALRDEVIVELVERCRVTQTRVRHFVNVTTNEELLRQGLSLNDDLQRVLTKHDAIRSGAPLPKEEALPASSRKANGLDGKTDYRKDRSRESSAQEAEDSGNPLIQLALPAPPQPASSKIVPLSHLQPTVDLLSGDVYEDRSAPTPATSPLTNQSLSELVLYSPAPETENPFTPDTVENAPSSQYSLGVSEQLQNSQQYPFANGNLQHHTSANGSLQQYPSSNENIMTQVQGFPQQPHPIHQADMAGQPFLPPAQSNYTASWAPTDNQSLPSQQNGLVPSHGLQSSQLQPLPQLNAYQQGHIGLFSSPGSDSPQIPVPPQNSAYPLAPWSENVPQPANPQQTAMLFGNNSSAPYSSQMQLYPQQPSMAFDQRVQLYAGGAPQNMIEQPWTYPQAHLLQNMSQFAQAGGQSSAQFSNQPFVPYSQSPMVPSKPANPADELFGDLVDLQKLSSRLKSVEISSNKTGTATGNV